MPKTLYITRGLQASGKSTWACEKAYQLNKDGLNCIILERDKLRHLLFGAYWSPDYTFTKDKERFVTKIQTQNFQEASESRLSIILSDTNLNPKVFDQWVLFGQSEGYEVEIVDEFLGIDLEECLYRDRHRIHPVGEKIIRQFADKYQHIINEYREKVVDT